MMDMTRLVHGVSLHYYNELENSDKIYNVAIHQVAGGYNVDTSHGRRGKTLIHVQKNYVPLTLQEAVDFFDGIVRSKTKKGYKVIQYIGGHHEVQ